jgi:hypothetical protein
MPQTCQDAILLLCARVLRFKNRDVGFCDYIAIGGDEALESTILNFYDRIMGDPALSPFFRTINVRSLIAHQNQFLALAFIAKIPKDFNMLTHM